MGMHKLDYIRRAPGIGDFNTLVDAVNEIIDRLNKKVEFQEIKVAREVKDYKFFNWEEMWLPFHAEHTIASIEDASGVFKQYALTYKEMNSITKAIEEWKIVSLSIDVTEEVTEKEKKQEAIFETVETVQIVEPEIEVVLPEKTKKKKEKKPSKKRKNSRATV